MKKILITGSRGYIGSNLVNFLKVQSSCPYSIIEVDNSDPRGNAWNVKEETEFDFLIHLAAAPGIKYCEENPSLAISTNCQLTYYLMEICQKKDVPFIFMSSQAAKDPGSSIYAMTKWVCESLGDQLSWDSKARIGILRLANVYGGMNFFKKSSVVSKFGQAYLNNESVVINGQGGQKRDFIHVFDVCHAIELMIKKFSENPPLLLWAGEAGAPILDIGTGIGTSVLDLAKKFNLEFTFRKESGIIGLESNIVNPALAKRLLDFEAVRKIEDYVNEIKERGDDYVF